MIKPYLQQLNLLKWESIDDHTGLREIIIEAYELEDFYDDHYFDITVFNIKSRELNSLEHKRLINCLEEDHISNYDDLEIFLIDLCYKGYLEKGLYIVDFDGGI